MTAEGLNQENHAETLKNLENTETYQQAMEAFKKWIESTRESVLNELDKRYAKKEYHNREHTEQTVRAHLGTMEIGKKYNLLEGPVDFEMAIAELAALFHDSIHFRGKDEYGMTAEEYSIQAFERAIDDFFSRIDTSGLDESELRQLQQAFMSEAKVRGREQIKITQINVAEMREVTQFELDEFDAYLGNDFVAEEAERIRGHIEAAPPAGTFVLDIRTNLIEPSSPFRLKSKVRSDVGYGGRSTPEAVAQAGDAEFIELDREKDEEAIELKDKPVVPVLKDPENYPPERVSAAVTGYLGHLNQQPGFFYNRWRIDEMTWKEDEQIKARPPEEQQQIIVDLRADSPNWKEVTLSTIVRYEDISKRYISLTQPEAFVGETAGSSLAQVRTLHQELTQKFAA